MKRWVRQYGLIAVALSSVTLLAVGGAQAASFSPSRLIDDAEFTSVDSMTADDVQRFLTQQGSFLAGYSENGRLASQIIVDAAHGFGDGSGTINGITLSPSTGTVSPAVLLVALQKEQGLISMTTQNDAALRTAMGYACPDSGGCNPNYAGFTKQVENAAWQLRYNYERAQGRGFSDFQVGQSQCFSNPSGGSDCTSFDNRATAALYRYTPHVYNGNYNFWNLFTNVYVFILPEYLGQHVGQSGNVAGWPGQTADMSISFRNGGRSTWSRTTPVNLAVDKWHNESFGATLRDSTWLSNYRIAQLPSATIASGATAVFPFKIDFPTTIQPGSYRFDVRLVADGVTWFDRPDTNGAGWWAVTVPRPTAQWVDQTAYQTLSRGDHQALTVRFRNTSGVTWKKNEGPPVNLAVDKYWATETAWQGNGWISKNRIVTFTESSVAPGDIATFTFDIAVPDTMPSGVHRFYARLVADGYSWFDAPDTNGGAWWQLTVR